MKNATEFVPAELIGQFENIHEAARALSAWKEQRRGPGRPKQKDKGVSLETLKKMIKPA